MGRESGGIPFCTFCSRAFLLRGTRARTLKTCSPASPHLRTELDGHNTACLWHAVLSAVDFRSTCYMYQQHRLCSG